MPSSPQFSWQCGSLLKFVEDIDYNAVNAHAKTQNRTKTKIASDPINDSLAGDAMNSRDFAHNKSTAMKAEATRGERERRRLSMRRQKRRSFIVEPRGQVCVRLCMYGRA